MKRQVIEWPMEGSGRWWLVENRGTDREPSYTPISHHHTRADAMKALDQCRHINLVSGWERPDGSPGDEGDDTEWVQRCYDCHAKIDLASAGGVQPYREPEREDPDTGYRHKA